MPPVHLKLEWRAVPVQLNRGEFNCKQNFDWLRLFLGPDQTQLKSLRALPVTLSGALSNSQLIQQELALLLLVTDPTLVPPHA